MKNNKVLYSIICVVALIVVNAVTFISIKEFTTARWINIGFLNLSVIILLIFSIMYGKKEDKFMNYSRFPIVGLYSLLAFIISALFIIFNLKNVTITIVVQIILLGLFIIAISLNTMSNNTAKQNRAVDKQNYNKIEDMSKRLFIIMQENENNRDLYKKIEKAYDDVKNAKISINEDTTQVDNDIIQSIAKIEFYIQNNNLNLIDEQITTIHNLVIKRNLMK